MDDYISRQEALEALSRIDVFNSVAFTPDAIAFGIGLAVAEIWGLPSAPVMEVKRGRWIGIDDEPHETWECDQCGFIQECFDGDQWKFCPNCGADMREDGE